MWQQPVTAVQKWSGVAAGCEWTPCGEWRRGVSCTLTWWSAVLESHRRSPPSIPVPSLPACFVLMCCCNHVSTSCASFFFSISPLHPSSFPDALSVSLWLQAERSSFSTKNVPSTDFASFQPGHRERCTGCVFYAGRSFHWGRQGHFSGSLHFNTYISLNVEWKWQSCTSCFEERWVSSRQQT